MKHKTNDITYSILYGTVLGDSYIFPNGCIQITQAAKHQEYIEWLYQKLHHITPNTGIKGAAQYDKRTGKIYSSYRFFTRAMFKDMRELFYPEGVKRLPHDFATQLDEIALSLWFLDDGSRATSTKAAVYITVDNFLEDEILQIQQVILDKFDIQTTIQKAGYSKTGNPQKRLYVGAYEYQKFYEYVNPIVSQIPSMKTKKLPLPLSLR